MSAGVRLTGLREGPLSVAECVAAVEAPAYGGIAVFAGAVRDEDGGRAVRELEYSAHPGALAELDRVAAAVAGAYPGAAVAAVHRVGLLAVGDLAVVVVAACPHRAEAFAAARRLIDDLKAQVPIWKRQVYVDGAEEWVGCP